VASTIYQSHNTAPSSYIISIIVLLTGANNRLIQIVNSGKAGNVWMEVESE
jgi:hypothetical protein